MRLILIALLFAGWLSAGTITATPGLHDFQYAGVQFGAYFTEPLGESDVMDGAIWVVSPDLPDVWFAAQSDLLKVNLNTATQSLQYFEATKDSTVQVYVDIDYMNRRRLESPNNQDTPEPWMFFPLGAALALLPSLRIR